MRGSVRALVGLVAGRMLLRGEQSRGWITRVALLSACVAVVALGVQRVDSEQIAAPLAFGVASLVLFGSLCVRTFTPALAVSVFGVGLGCASLVTVLAVTTGFERELARRMASLNGHVLLTKYGLDFFEYETIADRFIADERVVAASPFAFSMAAVVPDVPDDEQSPTMPAIVVGKGMDPARAAALHGISEVMGRGDLSALRPGDVRYLPGIALGSGVARELGVELGDVVSVVIPAEIDGTDEALRQPPRHARFEVLDLVHTGVGDLDTNLVLMHLSAAQAVFFREARVTGIEFELIDPMLAGEFAKELEATLPDMFRATTWEQQNEVTLVSLRQIRGAVALVLGLIELVAASSLVTSLLLLVRRKRGEIAVLMALGADARTVFWVFETIGTLAGGVGALAGVVLGLAYCGVIELCRYPLQGDVYPIDRLPVALAPTDALLPPLCALLLCAAASGPAAVVATRMGLLQGLRR